MAVARWLCASETGSGADGYETANAKAFAASGALLLGVAGSEARATNRSQSIAPDR